MFHQFKAVGHIGLFREDIIDGLQQVAHIVGADVLKGETNHGPCSHIAHSVQLQLREEMGESLILHSPGSLNIQLRYTDVRIVPSRQYEAAVQRQCLSLDEIEDC